MTAFRLPGLLFLLSIYFPIFYIVSRLVFQHVFPQKPLIEAGDIKTAKNLHLILILGYVSGCVLLGWLAKKVTDLPLPGKNILFFLGAATVIFALGVPFYFWILAAVALWSLRQKKELLLYMYGIGLIVLLTMIFWTHWQRWTPYPFMLHEDTTRLGSLSQVLLGQVPYRDLFLNFGILSDVARPFLAFRLWGTSYASDQTMRGIITALSTVIAFGLAASHARSKLLVLFAGLLFAWRPGLFISDRSFFTLVSVSLFASGLSRDSYWTLAAAGFSACLSFLYSFDTGVTYFFGLALFFIFLFAWQGIEYGLDIFRPFFAGLATGLFIFFVYLLWTESLVAYARDLGFQLFSQMAVWGDTIPTRLFVLHETSRSAGGLIFLIKLFPLVLVGFVVAYAFTFSRIDLPTRVLVLLLVAMSLLGQYFVYVLRMDNIHRDTALALYWPLLVLVMDEIVQACKEMKVTRQNAALVWPGAAMFMALCGVALLGTNSLWQFSVKSVSLIRESFAPVAAPIVSSVERLGKMSVNSADQQLLESVVASVSKAVPENEYFFDMTPESSHYFFVNRLNPTRYPWVGLIYGEERVQESLRALEKHPPRAVLVVWDGENVVFEPEHSPLLAFLFKNYTPSKVIGPYRLFVAANAR